LSRTIRNCATVLIVEDDQELRDMMVQLLVLEGFEAYPASDGLDALRQLRAPDAHADVILLDMMMPRMDGWEFCRERAQYPALRAIPIVVLSAAPRDRINVDAAAVLSKPFDYDRLLTAIRALC
jgi:CheY-like chemotaxis protein